MRRRDFVKLLAGLAATPALLSPGSAPALAQEAEPRPADESGPQSVRNNIVGLNLARLHQPLYIWAASDLVNANGGDWGYITVVWTIEDRDGRNAEYNLQLFLDRCFEFHVQPIIRVATKFEARKEPPVPGQGPSRPNPQGAEGSWTRPDWDEPAKWRAFFETGRWPTRHAWIVVGNEPNLGREWGGEVDGPGYARYLAHFLDVFADAPRFDVVSGPLDISNTSALPVMQDALEFLDAMDAAVPGIFERLPAWASNPYRVLSRGPGARFTHLAYEAELDHIGREMPVLITEAGHLDTGDDLEIARFYEEAFKAWMADPKVVAVTPLFWHPDRNDFWMFELDKKGAFVHRSPTYELLRRIPRLAGSPSYTVAMGNTARTERFEQVTVAEAPAADEDAAADAGSPASGEAVADPDLAGPEVADPRDVAPALAPRSAGGHVAASDGRAAPARTADASARHAGQGGLPLAEVRVANTNGQGATLRAAPAHDAAPIGVLPDGEVVQALGPVREDDETAWQQVRTPNGAEGWIAAELLEPADANAE